MFLISSVSEVNMCSLNPVLAKMININCGLKISFARDLNMHFSTCTVFSGV